MHAPSRFFDPELHRTYKALAFIARLSARIEEQFACVARRRHSLAEECNASCGTIPVGDFYFCVQSGSVHYCPESGCVMQELSNGQFVCPITGICANIGVELEYTVKDSIDSDKMNSKALCSGKRKVLDKDLDAEELQEKKQQRHKRKKESSGAKNNASIQKHVTNTVRELATVSNPIIPSCVFDAVVHVVTIIADASNKNQEESKDVFDTRYLCYFAVYSVCMKRLYDHVFPEITDDVTEWLNANVYDYENAATAKYFDLSKMNACTTHIQTCLKNYIQKQNKQNLK
jgi:hypothetical protein